jgi:glycine cleavage system H lipoate-binding protein
MPIMNWIEGYEHSFCLAKKNSNSIVMINIADAIVASLGAVVYVRSVAMETFVEMHQHKEILDAARFAG